jgi:hypothetical protein
MSEILIGILVVGVLVISDPDRLQRIIDRIQDLIVWLAE